ncbi:KAP family NTPase [Pseudomonas chlororaphis]|nr:KAP family NTPase [Pseudomonas chlororaphis]
MWRVFEKIYAFFSAKEKRLLHVEMDDVPLTIVNDENSHVREFLKYYLSLEYSPCYAVLVSGAWGIGKTFLVKVILKELMCDKPLSYVSLYGLDTVDAIDTALYQSLHPVLSSKGAVIAGRTGKAILKMGKVDGVLGVRDFIEHGKDRLYVFDDLERSPLKPEIVLGYINEMVEHDGCKVIIIGNEEKLLEVPGYQETKEKLIGRSLEVQAAVHGAFTHFLSQLKSVSAKKALEENSETVATIFREASATNFRVLQQTVWDFERIANCLEIRHFDSVEGVKTLIETFFAISFEAKAGHLTQMDILARPDSLTRAMMRGSNEEVVLPIDLANNRFSEADLYEPILSKEVLCDLLFKGIANPSLVRESLDRSRFYVDVTTEPAWRTIWHGFERSETDFDTALIEMERQFTAREFLEIGVILHVVGIRIWLSEIGALALTRAESLEQARKYIQDLYSSGGLVPSVAEAFGRINYEGYGGLGIRELAAQDFIEFIKYLEAMQSKVAVDSYPEKARELLEEMESNAGIFLRKICQTNDAGNIYAYVPLLAVIPPGEFVERVMRLDGANKRKVIMALNIRYSHGRLDRDLAAEKVWLIAVGKEFYSAMEPLSPIGRWSVSTALKQYLEPILPLSGDTVELEFNGVSK